MFACLLVLHRMCLTHTDLKPENIMLVDPEFEELNPDADNPDGDDPEADSVST